MTSLQEKIEFQKERERLRAELAKDKAERAAAYVQPPYAFCDCWRARCDTILPIAPPAGRRRVVTQ